MDKKIKQFDDTEIEAYKFHQDKNSFSINSVDISKAVVSNKLPFSKEDFIYFIGYKDTKKIRPLCKFCPKMYIFRRDFDETKCMYLLIKEENVLKNQMKFGKKLAISSKKNLIVNLYAIKNI